MSGLTQKLANLFQEHPRSVGETYFQHFKVASVFAIKMVLGGLACFIHCIFPFLFANTASHTIQQLSEQMSLRNNRK